MRKTEGYSQRQLSRHKLTIVLLSEMTDDPGGRRGCHPIEQTAIPPWLEAAAGCRMLLHPIIGERRQHSRLSPNDGTRAGDSLAVEPAGAVLCEREAGDPQSSLSLVFK